MSKRLLRRDELGCEILLTVEFAIVIVDVVLRLLDLRLHVAVVRLERVEIVAHDADLRVVAVERVAGTADRRGGTGPGRRGRAGCR